MPLTRCCNDARHAQLDQKIACLEQELGRLSRVEMDMRIWRAQATALRHEADLLQENALRDRELAASAERLRETLAVREETIVRLEQELDRLSRVELDMRIWRAQATALRYEADLLQENALRDHRELAASAECLRETLAVREETIVRLRAPLEALRRRVPNFLKPVLRGPAQWLRRRVFG